MAAVAIDVAAHARPHDGRAAVPPMRGHCAVRAGASGVVDAARANHGVGFRHGPGQQAEASSAETTLFMMISFG